MVAITSSPNSPSPSLSVGDAESTTDISSSNIVITSNGQLLDFDELFRLAGVTPVNESSQRSHDDYSPPVSTRFIDQSTLTEEALLLMRLIDELCDQPTSLIPADLQPQHLTQRDPEDVRTALLYTIDKIQKTACELQDAVSGPLRGYAPAGHDEIFSWDLMAETCVEQMEADLLLEALWQALRDMCEVKQLALTKQAANSRTDLS